MDDIVKQAMAKWPNVPHCYGWLGLDARGNWYMRDDRAQACGSFACGKPGAKGSLLQHEKLIAFIARNYTADPSGCWYFQNGPQRVYVELEATPQVWRVDTDFRIESANVLPASTPIRYQQALVDEHGWLYLETSTGFGLVHTQDVLNAASAIEQGLWQVQDVQQADLPRRYNFVASPALAQPTRQC